MSILGRPRTRYISQIYKSDGLPQSLSRKKMFFLERDQKVSTWFKLTGYKDMLNPVILVLPPVAPDADGGRVLNSVRWILC